jgi:hypothetical protein
LDYPKLISTIQHELKHIWDILFMKESDENTFLKNRPINILKKEFQNTDYYQFIHMVYESLRA